MRGIEENIHFRTDACRHLFKVKQDKKKKTMDTPSSDNVFASTTSFTMTMSIENSDAGSQDDEFDVNKSHFLRVQVKFWLMSVIIPCGLLLNSLAFCVFLASPSLRQYTRTLFLMALCVADSLYLIGELLIWLNTSDPHYGQIFHTEFIHTTRLWCSVAYFLRYAGQFASSWLVVALAVERFVLLARPIRIKHRRHQLMTSAIICSILVISVGLNAYPFWTLDIKDFGGFTMCNVIDVNTMKIWSWVVMRVGALLLPAVLVTIFTALIIWKLRQLRLTSWRSMEVTSNGVKQVVESRRVFTELDKQHIAMLLTIAVFFVLLRFPYMLMYYIFTHVVSHDDDVSVRLKHGMWLATDVCYAIAALNYAVNFFLYCVSSRLFRDRFLCKNSRSTDDVMSQTEQSKVDNTVENAF